MKNLPLASILVLVYSVAAFAQTEGSSPCPEISVTGPSAFAEPNEPIIFTATVGKEIENFGAKYEWSASSREIIEGQGTLSVRVKFRPKFIKNL